MLRRHSKDVSRTAPDVTPHVATWPRQHSTDISRCHDIAVNFQAVTFYFMSGVLVYKRRGTLTSKMGTGGREELEIRERRRGSLSRIEASPMRDPRRRRRFFIKTKIFLFSTLCSLPLCFLLFLVCFPRATM